MRWSVDQMKRIEESVLRLSIWLRGCLLNIFTSDAFFIASRKARCCVGLKTEGTTFRGVCRIAKEEASYAIAEEKKTLKNSH